MADDLKILLRGAIAIFGAIGVAHHFIGQSVIAVGLWAGLGDADAGLLGLAAFVAASGYLVLWVILDARARP